MIYTVTKGRCCLLTFQNHQSKSCTSIGKFVHTENILAADTVVQQSSAVR